MSQGRLRRISLAICALVGAASVLGAAAPARAQSLTGACCVAGPTGNTCSVTTAANCATLHGIYVGNGTSCATSGCLPPSPRGQHAPLGACCLVNATGSLVCIQLVQYDCAVLAGTYRGFNSSCTVPGACPGAPRGACCLSSGRGNGAGAGKGSNSYCVDVNEVDCRNQGGTYRGNGVRCTSVQCPIPPLPTGACCLLSGNVGSCVQVDRRACLTQGGTYAGDGTSCATTPCPGAPRGACCLNSYPSGGAGGGGGKGSNSFCTDVQAAICAQLGGTYHGNGTDCRTVICPTPPLPTGACCLLTGNVGSCVQVDRRTCLAQSGTYAGNGTSCTTTPCAGAPRGACCLPAGNSAGGGGLNCTMVQAAVCTNLGGTYQGNGSSCRNVSCIPPPTTGACCVPTATGGFNCVTVAPTTCSALGGTFQGLGTTCATAACAPPCPCDFDGDGRVTQSDENAFLAAFAAGNADINHDGFTDGADYDLFYSCYVQGC